MSASVKYRKILNNKDRQVNRYDVAGTKDNAVCYFVKWVTVASLAHMLIIIVWLNAIFDTW